MAELNDVLNGVSQGLLNGMNVYNQARQRQIQEQYAQGYNQQTQAGLLQKGMQTDENGNVSFNPAMQQQIDYQRSAVDPTSEHSQKTREFTQGLLQRINPQYAGLINENMSAQDIENNPFINDTIKGEFMKQGREMSNQRMAESNEIKRQQVGLHADTQASQAASTIHNDKRVLTLTQQLDQLERGRGILDQPTITKQEFNDYQQEIQNAISGASQGGALGKLERTEYTTAKGELAALKQKLTGVPEDAVPRELVDRLKNLADHTHDIMARHRSDRAESLRRNFPNNANAQDAMDQAINIYKFQPATAPQQGLLNQQQQPSAGGKAAGATTPLQDSQAVEWARANPNDPRAKKILQANGVQ